MIARSAAVIAALVAFSALAGEVPCGKPFPRTHEARVETYRAMPPQDLAELRFQTWDLENRFGWLRLHEDGRDRTGATLAEQLQAMDAVLAEHGTPPPPAQFPVRQAALLPTTAAVMWAGFHVAIGDQNRVLTHLKRSRIAFPSLHLSQDRGSPARRFGGPRISIASMERVLESKLPPLFTPLVVVGP